jgi:hypothetical protein
MFAEPVAVPVVAAASEYVTVARTDCANACAALASVVTNSRVSAVPFAGHMLAVEGMAWSKRAETTVPESFTNVRSTAEMVAAAPPVSRKWRTARYV